jgi:hypothetical protein
MQGLRKGEWSAITKVKVLSPEICLIALGQGFLHLEASSAARDKGQCVSDVPGSESMAGHSKIHSGTWDSHIVPKEASNEPKRQRRKYGDMAVGLTHSRGVNGVMPIESQESGHSKGLAVKRRGMSSVCHTLKWITSRWQYCPHISTGS